MLSDDTPLTIVEESVLNLLELLGSLSTTCPECRAQQLTAAIVVCNQISIELVGEIQAMIVAAPQRVGGDGG